MTATNVKSAWSGGDLYFYDKSGNEILHFDGTNRQLVIPTGSSLLLGGNTLTPAELSYLDGLTAGTVTASKAVVVDANKDIGDFRNLDAVNVDAGASGTAGSVDIFPATAARGKIAITAANSAGDTTTTIVNASQAAARTYTMPDAGNDAAFAMTEGAQTFNGVQTYTLPRVADHNTGITAFATGGQANATALTGEWNNVTVCATAGDSVKLPAAIIGQVVTVKNSGATTLAVFPASSDAINALAANLSVDIPPGAELTFRAIDAVTWETCEVLTLPAPTTQKGSLVIQAADSAGNTNTTLTNASQAAARTFTITDPAAAAASIHPAAVFVDGADGAVTIKSGVVFLTKAGVEADTLAAPVAGTDDGKTLVFMATTANAHTVTQAAPGFNNGGAGSDVATFGGAVGDNFVTTAYNGVWYVVSTRNVTLG